MRALITGATSGIGSAVYDHFVERGIKVVGLSRRGPEECMDLLHYDTRRWTNIIKQEGPFDIVFLNAGVCPIDDWDSYEKTMLLNLKVPLWFLRYEEIHRDLMKADGSIIVSASLLGITGCSELPIYSAGKAALINAVRSYAKVHVVKNVRVNCISCGIFDTPMNTDLGQSLIDHIPMKRKGRVAELLPVIDALVNCTYVTGQNWIIDGGDSLQ
jgi:NAD(P)-dependent dehydrogenase (short-subunit alcohol dehydrogenase family)